MSARDDLLMLLFYGVVVLVGLGGVAWLGRLHRKK